ncbi:MAG: hypothetical protein P8J01_05505 [Acidimicrobiales bacterium]|nr:hypothetical protein [Acidimicrobiales bacterium]
MTTPSRYRCTACGNLTRFDLVRFQRTREFHHFTTGGELKIEEHEVLEEMTESVSCRWCESSQDVVKIETD